MAIHDTVNTGVDHAERWYTSAASKKKSSDNAFKDWINDIRVGFYEEADYGTDWAAGGSGVTVVSTFPSPASPGVLFVRVNTNTTLGTDEMREYRYNGKTAAWEYAIYT